MNVEWCPLGVGRGRINQLRARERQEARAEAPPSAWLRRFQAQVRGLAKEIYAGV